MVCLYCEVVVSTPGPPVCSLCGEYKGVMTVDAWEAYTGLKWDDEE